MYVASAYECGATGINSDDHVWICVNMYEYVCGFIVWVWGNWYKCKCININMYVASWYECVATGECGATGTPSQIASRYSHCLSVGQLVWRPIVWAWSPMGVLSYECYWYGIVRHDSLMIRWYWAWSPMGVCWAWSPMGVCWAWSPMGVLSYECYWYGNVRHDSLMIRWYWAWSPMGVCWAWSPMGVLSYECYWYGNVPWLMNMAHKGDVLWCGWGVVWVCSRMGVGRLVHIHAYESVTHVKQSHMWNSHTYETVTHMRHVRVWVCVSYVWLRVCSCECVSYVWLVCVWVWRLVHHHTYETGTPMKQSHVSHVGHSFICGTHVSYVGLFHWGACFICATGTPSHIWNRHPNETVPHMKHVLTFGVVHGLVVRGLFQKRVLDRKNRKIAPMKQSHVWNMCSQECVFHMWLRVCS